MRSRRTPFVLAVLIFVAANARAANGPILHEQIPADPREDAKLAVSLDGDLPSAIETSSGVVAAPDPRAPVSTPAPYAPGSTLDTAADSTFRPDRDTRRPDALPYDDPFSPSTAPFKRLVAYDVVDASFNLGVADPQLRDVPLQATARSDEDQFFADMIVELASDRFVRIPTVGPGSRIVHARAANGATSVPMKIVRDGADNWFAMKIDTKGGRTSRVRFVMEFTIPRATFGGDFGDPSWTDLPRLPELPHEVANAATEVATRIGVSRAITPRENVRKLVAYFRDFVDSDAPLAPSADVYRDLALSKKGVCRHRAYAFTVTALSLGIPTRMILNEAHAWVEVNDGSLWKRIDLGGAGNMLEEKDDAKVAYAPPSDPFAWPPGATPGDAMNGLPAQSGHAPNGSPAQDATSPFADAGASAAIAPTNDPHTGTKDERPRSLVSLIVTAKDAHRGGAVDVRGSVAADKQPCAHVIVDVTLRESSTKREAPIGSLATDDSGAFAGALVLPASLPLGDYDVVARTEGDARCGPGSEK